MCLLNCKWQVLPLVFLPANAYGLISSELLGGFFWVVGLFFVWLGFLRGRSVAQTNLIYKHLFLCLHLDF